MQPPPSTGGAINVRDPNGLYFADVLATGTGCPAGSWRVSISGDGKAFTMTFSKYEVNLSETNRQDRMTLACTINMVLNSPSGLSYAVTEVSYSGYAYLEPGASARLTTFYNFSGQSLTGVDGGRIPAKVHDITAPKDDEYLFEDTVSTTDYVWSECGRSRSLNVSTSLRLLKTNLQTNAYVNMATADGETRLVLRLATRTCRT